MFNMPTSGPLSPIVSLERRKLEQQGIPPGQEQQGSAAKGAPISGDLAQLIQLNRMLQQRGTAQQQANAAPSTVAQDLMQRAGQQMQPQMQQMPPQMDPRQQGIAQLPQEAVGNGMAAGGIVAFNEGGYSFNMMDDVEKQRRKEEQEAREKAAAEMETKRQATLKAIAQRNTQPSKGEGLAEFVPTLSYSKRNLHDVAIENAGFDVQKDYGKIRKKMEEESGLAGIWKKQQEEQERLKAEVSPEARKKAFYNNLAEQLAGQIGQRGVSTSSRLAQMVGAYGATRSTTDKETKKLEAELNKAANDLQEKQAMYRATGAMADREAMAKATQNYEKAALDKQTAEQQEKKDAEDRKLKERQLQIQAAAGGRDKTPWESLGPQITRLTELIQTKRASGASPQEIAPLQAQLDNLMKVYNQVQPSIYGANARTDATYATLEQKARQAAANTTQYKSAESKLRLIQSNPEVNPDNNQKWKSPADRDAAIQNLQAQQDQAVATHLVRMNREGAAQGGADSGSGKVVDFNSLPPT
jgi:hypothetical protein